MSSHSHSRFLWLLHGLQLRRPIALYIAVWATQAGLTVVLMMKEQRKRMNLMGTSIKGGRRRQKMLLASLFALPGQPQNTCMSHFHVAANWGAWRN